MKSLFYIIILSTSVSSFAKQNPTSTVNDLAGFRKDLELKMDNTPYYNEEHAAIKKYFSELRILNTELENNRRFLKSFNSYIRNDGAKTFCSEALLDTTKWTVLVGNCTKNNFFLCSEDVKLYPIIKETFIKLLDEDVQNQLAEMGNCL